jgi:uncharacterized protein (DUF58 family)
MPKARPGAFRLAIDAPPGAPRRLRIGIALPPAIESEHGALEVAVPGGVLQSVADWPCTPRARGRFAVEGCFVETPSPLGLWRVRRRTGGAAEFRVYPNLMGERTRLAALFLNRGAAGIHAQRLLGKGREFEKLREYAQGDSYEDVHWKATAKRGRPITKLYQAERTQEVYVAIDASRLSARRGPSGPCIERTVAAALVLGLVAQRQGDLFGLLAFSRRVTRFVKAAGGKGHFDSCRDALYTLTPELAAPDFGELCVFVRRNLRRRALLVVLTDLGDPVLAEEFLAHVGLIGRQHLVLAGMIRPEGVRPFFGGPEAAGVDGLYQALGGHIVWRNLRELQRTLRHRGVTLSFLSDERLSAELVTEYMTVKARQLL